MGPLPRYRPLTLALSVWLLASGCPPPTVIVNGREVPREEGDALAYQAAEESARAANVPEAIARFEGYLRDFPQGKRAADALFALGQLLERAGRDEAALEAYRGLVAEHPESPHYMPATVQLGLVLVRLGRTQEALPTLQSVFDRLPDRQRKAEVAGMLAESYERSGAPVEALRWYAVLHQHAEPGPAREVLAQKVEDLVDGSLSFKAVREAVEILRAGGGFPFDLLQLKLAKIFYHVGELAEAQRALEDFVARFPGHARSAEAGALLKRILDRHKVNPVAVGVLLPLTGEYREYGQKALESIQLGAGVYEEARADRPQVVLVIRDTAGKPEQAAGMVEDLVFQEHVAAVIGPMFAGEAYAAAIKAQELEVPLLALSARPELTAVGPYVFRNFLTLEAQAEALVRYAMETLKVKKFALLYPNDKYGVGFVNAFWDEVKKREGEVRAAERYEPDTKTYAEPIKKMVGRWWMQARWEYMHELIKIRREKDTNLAKQRAIEKLKKTLRPVIDFQAIFVPDYYENVALLAPALAFEDIVLKTTSQYQIDRLKKSLGRDDLDMVYLLGGNGWNSPKLVEWAERYVQGAVFTDGFFAESSRPATRMFVAKFKTHFDRRPDAVDAHAHDAALMARQVVERARPQSRKAFREALLGLSVDGAMGPTRFRPDREAEKELFLLTVKREEIKEIEPEPSPHAGS